MFVAIFALSAGSLAEVGAQPAPQPASASAGPAMLENLGNATPMLGLSSSIASLPPLQNITAIAAGGYHTCAVTAGGGVKCWGKNRTGALGDGTTVNRRTPVDVVGLSSGVTAIAAGNDHTCAVTASGGVKCWGANGFGGLGDGTTVSRSTPVEVVGLSSGVTAIAAGFGHTCSVPASGGARCWGANGFGQLGDGTTANRSTPVEVVTLLKVYLQRILNS
jgi:alpha-tubulin suppressor-like RCC1 family protein